MFYFLNSKFLILYSLYFLNYNHECNISNEYTHNVLLIDFRRTYCANTESIENIIDPVVHFFRISSFVSTFKGNWEIKEYSYISLECVVWGVGNGSLFMSPVETRGKHRVMSNVDVTDIVGSFFFMCSFVFLLCWQFFMS